MERENNVIIEISSGGVVFRKTRAGVKILLLRKKGKKGLWVLPKGKVDQGESLEDAALREEREETGLQNIKIFKKIGKENYFFRRIWQDKKLVAKTVYYFLVESSRGKSIPQKEEGFAEAKWFSMNELLNKIAYKESKKILTKALNQLEKYYGKF